MNGFKKLNLGMSILIFLAAFGLHAEENQSSTSSNKVKASDLGVKQQEQKDIDEEITNARLRASTGSKSKISIQTDMSYIGASIYSPFAKQRPDLSPGSDTEDVKLSGNISGKYRIGDSDAINVGSGMALLTPGYDGQRGQIENPYISYGRVFKSGNLQNVLSVSATNFTAERVKKQKRTFDVSLSHTVLGNLSQASKWQVGISSVIGTYVYSEFNAENAGKLNSYLGLYPFAEYEFSDSYSFRTVYRGVTFYTTRDNTANYLWDEATQSMGLGITITRDIYLYPNVQWVWRDIRADKTNVALSANINFF